MKQVSKMFNRIFSIGEDRKPTTASIYQEWDRMRSKAMTPSEVAEIDAIFSRAL